MTTGWRRLFLVAVVVFSITIAAHAAQLDSIELTATDPTATAKWYNTNFGGKRAGDSVKFGGVTIKWKKAAPGAPVTNPAIGHVGFAADDIVEKLAALQKAGIKVVKEVHTGPLSRWAIVADPNGMAVGLIEKDGFKGLTHVMLNAPLLSRRETLGWYQKVVGGEVENFGGSPLWTGIRTNNTWVLFSDDMPGRGNGNDYTTASMTWRVDDVGPAKEIQKSRSDSDEKIGEGLVVIDPCGLPVRFVEDPKSATVTRSGKDLATSAEIQVTDEHYKIIKAYKGDFKVEVVRILGQDDCTLGQLFVNNVCLRYVLELPWKGNKPMISSIPPGTYKLSLHNDSKQRMRVHLEGVPGRQGIQMHIGTTPEDTQGCVLIGTGMSAVHCTLTNTREAVARLRKAYYGTENPKKLTTDRPAVMTISDSITTSSEAAKPQQPK